MRGFSLIETVVTISLMSVALLALSMVIVFFYRTNANVLEQSAAISSARRGIENAMKDLREATVAADGSFAIASAGPNSITFYADVDKDNSVERVRYDLASEVLTRYTLQATGTPPTYSGQETSEIISDNVRNAIFVQNVFQYFDIDGNELSSSPSPLDIKFVTATIIVNVNPTRAPEEFTLTSSATLRNLRVE
ncbi:MAG: type II secretion system protein J [Patescibacteria group bacterium UBA2103]